MNPAVTRWLEALRSGQYMQGKEKLHTKDDSGTESYCCLGVACAISDSVKAETSKFDNHIVCYRSGEYVHKYYLPDIVRHELGLRTKVGQFIVSSETKAVVKLRGLGAETSLAALNDNGATFEQIAKIIELRPQGLFVDETI
jgi:hypothetical protein